MKDIIQPGIYQGPIQAFTALCSTKIVAATDRGVWGKNLQKMREINHGNFHPKHACLWITVAGTIFVLQSAVKAWIGPW